MKSIFAADDSLAGGYVATSILSIHPARPALQPTSGVKVRPHLGDMPQ
jgi:hypothetical protein